MGPLLDPLICSSLTMATTDGLGTQKAHRLSSLDADQAELYGGTNVIMPPKYLMASTRDCVASDIDSDKVTRTKKPFPQKKKPLQ